MKLYIIGVIRRHRGYFVSAMQAWMQHQQNVQLLEVKVGHSEAARESSNGSQAHLIGIHVKRGC